ncbi:MAG: TIGR02996 domain-containing protein [Gemmataceae bacterium]|nr:TIGR02996 domain-containing protein [Gemmataceae bacterium]
MTDEPALLRAICSHPGDDTPRLVFADWLEERGQPERAEFIRDCCGPLGAHTDCPGRLADLVTGRPVPLRCGRCDYCRARRRAERFYRGHQWLDLPAYAVALEPTPLDGELHTGPGITAVVRRGFVDEFRCDWPTFSGGTCRRCDGNGQRHGDDRTYPPTPCPACRGTGRVPGLAEAVAWRPGWTVGCENCDGTGTVGRDHGYSSDGPCPDCGGRWEPIADEYDRGYSPGSGRVPRPMPASVQPIRKVVLTTLPDAEWLIGRLSENPGWLLSDALAAEWPGVDFFYGRGPTPLNEMGRLPQAAGFR